MFDYELMKEKRKKLKLTQIELAKLVGVTQASISSYEKGEIAPKHETRKKIAEALKLSVDELSGENLYTKEGKPKTYWEALDHESAFVKYLENLGYSIEESLDFDDIEVEDDDGNMVTERYIHGRQYKIEKGDLPYITLTDKELMRLSSASRKNVEFLLWEIYNDQWQ